MTRPTSIAAIACAPGALTGGPSRTRFFDGMFLTQADLENEQRFWRLKRRLTNRALGDGVVWGLRLAWDPQRRTFALSPGYALDCCGNDLIVEGPVEVSEAELWSRADPALRGTSFGKNPLTPGWSSQPSEGNARRACVVLQYTECPEEPRTVHRDACAGTTGYCEPSRVRETARLLLVPPPAPRLTPPEQFIADLESFRDGLPQNIRDALFPPQGGATPEPATGLVPLQLIVTVPGSPADGTWTGTADATATLPPGTSGTVTQGPISTAQLVTASGSTDGPRSAVVTFQLQPTSGWGFTAGQVLDHARVVATVTPPMAPSIYWAFDLAAVLHDTTQADFEFRVDNVQVSQLFGGTQQGRVSLLIEGTLVADESGEVTDMKHAKVTVQNLRVTTLSADISEVPSDKGCLRELVPWGAIVDPGDGRRIAGALVLSSLYAFLSEVVQRGAPPQTTQIATLLYGAAYYAIYGVNGFTGQIDEQYKKKLSQLVLDLYRRWCDALAYPGPRCIDEHHGVYLGCVEIDRTGRIVSFDMWESRRYVVTGALLGHWARQFGIAPLDVIAGRFARAICCLSGLPPIVLPGIGGKLAPGAGGEGPADRFHIGTAESVGRFAKLHGAKLRWTTPAGVAARVTEAFVLHGTGHMLEVVATQLVDGGSIAIAVPSGGGDRTYASIRSDVTSMLRRGDLHTYERGRVLVADFAIEVLTRTSPGLLKTQGSLAGQLEKEGASVADVLDLGAEGIVARVDGKPDSDIGNADALVDAAEAALDGLIAITVKTLTSKIDRGAFKTSADKLAKAVGDAKLPFDPPAISAAANKVGQG